MGSTVLEGALVRASSSHPQQQAETLLTSRKTEIVTKGDTIVAHYNIHKTLVKSTLGTDLTNTMVLPMILHK